MRGDYAKKKSDMLEKTRLVRNSLHIQTNVYILYCRLGIHHLYHDNSFSSRERWSLLQMNTRDSLGYRKDSREV